MKTFIFATFFSMCTIASAQAENPNPSSTHSNYCVLNRSERIPFTKYNDSSIERFGYHEAYLSAKIRPAVTRRVGHSTVVTLSLNYEGVLIKDQFSDFAAPRMLALNVEVDGNRVYCRFDPTSF